MCRLRRSISGTAAAPAPDAPDLPEGFAFAPEYASEYASSMRSAAQSELETLNSSVNWALTLTLSLVGIVGINVVAENVPDTLVIFAFILLAASVPLLTHFAIRIMKAYINIVRFSTLERATLVHALQVNPDNSLLKRVIVDYHLEWKSPIPHQVILVKALTSFGLLYPLIGVLSGITVLAFRVWSSSACQVIVTVSVALAASVLEYMMFRRSAYGRTILPDPTAIDLR